MSKSTSETASETASDTVGVAGDRIRSFVERVEQLEVELAEINEQKKEVFAEAKGEGFDVKVLREIIKLRKQDPDERDEHDSLLDVYLRAMNREPAEAGEAPARSPSKATSNMTSDEAPVAEAA